jgi:hypothetical protein
MSHPQHFRLCKCEAVTRKKPANSRLNRRSSREGADELFDSANQRLDLMKALIIYDDITCAANTTAILHRVAHHADITVKWEITPWRLNRLEFPPTANQALEDAADAHLIVFAVRSTPRLPAWLMDWLEEWARHRQIPDAAVAIIGDGTAVAAVAPATTELSRFARQHGLSFIFNNHGGIDDERAFIDPKLNKGGSGAFSAQPVYESISRSEGNDN